MKRLLELKGVLDCQLEQPQRGGDDLVLCSVATQRDELEVGAHRSLVEIEDAPL